MLNYRFILYQKEATYKKIYILISFTDIVHTSSYKTYLKKKNCNPCIPLKKKHCVFLRLFIQVYNIDKLIIRDNCTCL